MRGKGRYGQFIKWLFSAVDMLVLNAAYFVTCWYNEVNDVFFSKIVWLMLNVAYVVVIYFFGDIHNKRVVYADRVLVEVVKSVLMHVAIFVTLLSFLDLTETSWQVIARFYLLFFVGLSLWWIGSRKLIKAYRTRGFNYKRIVV
ncbi:MAG: undecaprenyl-phosphate glucose phosphotransferase, partial [Muribaculaceae bacterium]|nr:undecaprenyl-phosphate glucose phosphotransferase [Muribaculaceae bacterium]